MSPKKGIPSSSSGASLSSFGRTRSSSGLKLDDHHFHLDSGSSGGGKSNQRQAKSTSQSVESQQNSATSDGSCASQGSSSKNNDEDGEGDGDSSAEADGTDDEEPESFAPSHATLRSRDRRRGTFAGSDSHHKSSRSKGAARRGELAQQHGMGRTSRSIAKVPTACATKRSLSNVNRSSDGQDQRSKVGKLDSDVYEPPRKRAKSARSKVEAQCLDRDLKVGPIGAHNAAKQSLEAETISSEDDEYEGVDLISDSDPDDPDIEANVERLEERNILDEDENEAFFAGVSRLATTGSDWDDMLLTDGLLLGDVPFFAQQIGRGEEILDEEVEMFRTAFNRRSSLEASPSRRVRWEDEVGSASTSTMHSDEESAFPDLFVEAERYRDMIESEPSDGGISYWDLEENHDSWFANDCTAHGKQGSQSDQETSTEYETDEGETTDEDESLMALKKCARNETHRRSTSSSALEAGQSSYKSTTPSSLRRKGPSMVSWAADPTKPYAVTNSAGNRIVVYPPKYTSKTQSTLNGQSSTSNSSVMDTSPRTSFVSMVDDDRSEVSYEDYNNAPLGASDPILFGNTFRGEIGNNYLQSSSMHNPSNALYRLGLQSNGLAITQIDNNDGEGNINLRDFLDFGEDSSDSEVGGNQDEVLESPTTTSNAALPSRSSPTDRSSPRPDTSQCMLSHFDLRGVAAFRRNQTRHSTILSRPQQFAMAHNAPFHSRSAIKGGRFAAAQTPLSPLRKRRPSKSVGFNGRQMPGFNPKNTVSYPHHNRSKSAL